MATVSPAGGIPARSGRPSARVPGALSPNCGPRRNGARPSLVVLHYTEMATAEDARARLCDPEAEVSAHYLVSRQGEVTALVPEELRAWHAGAGSWGAIEDVNSHSIGIELDNDGASPFPEPQMRALEGILAAILLRWQIAPAGVIAHSDMAPLRKRDPGPRFDWRRLALTGLSAWPDPHPPVPPDAAGFRALLRAAGYPDVADAALLTAFRLRFRPGAQGPLDPADMALAQGVSRFAVDRVATTA
ncbi:N-acetylmuramoyl-L-alanine amidase [Plastorhodobacter daqingensis]|uniref:N-acetylmuramoyl-L-alanine amidase n=1 Tax=Plastorhodobacter daqingensis TaxID=1387281 RepID=A0ABW2UJQ7_9RHOB